MNLFCTHCGAAVSAQTRFCTGCGTAREPEAAPTSTPTPATAAPTAPVPAAASARRRTWPWWVLAVIAFFLLGLWLGRGPAAKKPLCGAPGVVQGGQGKLMQEQHGHLKIGRGGPGDPPSLSGGGGSTTVNGHGKDGEGAGDDTDISGGGGGGKAPAGDGDSISSPGGNADQLQSDFRRYAQGKRGADAAAADDVDGNAPASGKSFRADDFTYDKTNLPRYPDAVSAVMSSISYGDDGRTDTYSTGAGIMTSSSFDTVVTWYRQNLPPGWHDMTIGDMRQLSNQLSSTSILQALGGQPSDSATAASAAAPTPAADQIRLSLFSPPAGSKAKTGVMILQHGDSPVEALLQAKVAPSP